MKKTILLAAPLGLILFYGTSQVTAQDPPECEPMDIPVCQNARVITINNNGKSVAPRNLCIDPGETITVNVVPEGSASIEGKSGGWPTGSGSSFTLVAPEESGEYDYNVYFSDGSCLDPRISVKD